MSFESNRAGNAGFQAEGESSKDNSTLSRLDVLKEEFENIGVGGEIIELPESGKISQAIIFPESTQRPDDMVRIYRGIRDLKIAAQPQTPYSQRTFDSEGKMQLVDDLKDEVENLAQKPTYTNLIHYAEKMKSHADAETSRRLDISISEIEDGVLKGYSVRTELKYQQIGHLGGYTDVGVSPYVSASWNADEAMKYSGPKGGVMVIDIPISKIQDFDAHKLGETHIKGSLESKYIRAVIPYTDNSADIAKARELIEKQLPTTNEDVNKLRESQLKTDDAFDGEQRETDVKIIQHTRALRLINNFPEVGINLSQQWLSEGDIYLDTRQKIFDHYSNIYQTESGGRDISLAVYITGGTSFKNFERDKVDDEMLYKLRDLVITRFSNEDNLNRS